MHPRSDGILTASPVNEITVALLSSSSAPPTKTLTDLLLEPLSTSAIAFTKMTVMALEATSVSIDTTKKMTFTVIPEPLVVQ